MSVTLILGPMFAGKTSALHSHIAKAMLAGKPTMLLVPNIDTRYTRKALSTSHDGIGLQATRTDKLLSIAVPTNGTVVGVEEAHFFEDLPTFLVQQTQAGNHVVVAGLHADSNRQPWPCISQAMALADHIVFKHAVCICCGENASCSKRIENTQQGKVQVGGADKYVAVCNQCFYKDLTSEHLEAFQRALARLKSKREWI